MPRNTTSSVFFYIYVLESLKDGKRYMGYTNNLKKRIEEHKKGLSFATKCRENYLKTTQGTRFLGLRLIQYQRQKKTFGTGS